MDARGSAAKTKYRADIDGLRAVAVVSVLLFHAQTPMFGGGFVGVDVFFVISGYLITAILVDETVRGHFSILAFYDRRIRRIFPALFTVLFFIIVMGSILFPDRDLRDLSNSLIATVLFASNILFWLRFSYFNQTASREPVLHTWSLSVEEQFYIVFPLLLFVLYRWFHRRNVAATIATLAALSFAASAWCAYRFPSAAFYLTPFRAWELLLGSLMAVDFFPAIRTQRLREIAALAGLVLICWAVIMFTPFTIFPGLSALFPCVGAALVIHAGQDGSSTVGKGLSWRPVVFIGLISYSLYLWHWPLFVFAETWNLGDLDGAQTVTVIAASFGLAALTWRYIENPFRRKQIFVDRFMLFGAASVAMVLGLAVGAAGRANLWEGRISLAASRLENAREDSSPRRRQCHDDDGHITPYEDKCVYGAPGVVPQYAIWGDSHAVELVAALGEIAADHGHSILHISYSACAASFGDDAPSGRGCRDHNNAVFRKLVADPTKKVVFLNSRYREGLSKDGFRAVVDGLLAAGKRVVIVYPFPSADNSVPFLLASAAMRGRDPEALAISYTTYRIENAEGFAFLDSLPRGKNIERVFPHERLCTKFDCAMSKDGLSLYFDSHHISMAGARFLKPLFGPVFDKPLH